MKKTVFFLSLLIGHQAFSQNNIGTTYGNHNDLNASKYQPSELDLGHKHGQIGFNYYLWMGNSAFDYKTVNDIYETGKISNADVDNLLGKLQKKNIFGVGQDYQVLGLALQFKTKSENKIDIGLTVVDKFGLNFLYTDNFLKLTLKGNKQFAGQTVELGPLALNANYRREYVAGTAFNIKGSGKDVGIRVGFRGKYIQGIGSLYMPKGNATMTTDADGKYIDLEFDYKVHTSGLKDFSLFKYNGTGIGFDAGVTFFLSKYLEVVASILDVGAIKYTKNTNTYQKSAKVRYDGMAIDRLFGDNAFNGDSMASIFTPDKTQGDSYSMPLDTKICLEGEIKTSRKDKKDREYVSNAIFFTYIQGLNNMPGATTRPFLSLGYNHDFHKFFDAGVCATMGGYNKYTFGTFFSLNIAHVVKLGFSSDNLMAFIIPGYGTGIDFSTNFSVSF
jgi:hypothetical protein